MKETKYFEELFNSGVKQEDANKVLRQYLNTGFTDGKNGDRADESEPFERCENELLERFGASRDELEEIYRPW